MDPEDEADDVDVHQRLWPVRSRLGPRLQSTKLIQSDPEFIGTKDGSERGGVRYEMIEMLNNLEGLLGAAAGAFISHLARFRGKKFDTFEQNRFLASALSELCEVFRVRFKCPECGQPAMLRCSKVPGMPTGAFQFKHTETAHGGSATVPTKFSLMPAPPDKRRKGLGTTDGSAPGTGPDLHAEEVKDKEDK